MLICGRIISLRTCGFLETYKGRKCALLSSINNGAGFAPPEENKTQRGEGRGGKGRGQTCAKDIARESLTVIRRTPAAASRSPVSLLLNDTLRRQCKTLNRSVKARTDFYIYNL